jgi:hypothetical protein
MCRWAGAADSGPQDPPDPPAPDGAPEPRRSGRPARLAAMETMHAAGRRTLPPVPRAAAELSGTPDAVAEVASHSAPSDAAQQFVARLRSAAADFAAAAGASTAVVREAVPPARHRRARCRVVLRYADGAETDVTFLGPAGTPGTPSRHGFDRQIQRWLGGEQLREGPWVVADPDAPDGVAVDVTAWIAAA